MKIEIETSDDTIPMWTLKNDEFAVLPDTGTLIFREHGEDSNFVALVPPNSESPGRVIVDGYSRQCSLRVKRLPPGTVIKITL